MRVQILQQKEEIACLPPGAMATACAHRRPVGTREVCRHGKATAQREAREGKAR